MEIKSEFINQIIDCEWLSNCGKEDDLGFEVEYIQSQSKLEKAIKSVHWENVCLEACGEFTSFLHRNYKAIYNQHWNKIVRMVKSDYIDNIAKRLEVILLDDKNKNYIIADIKINLVTIFMAEYYSKYYTSDFYNKMLKIYVSGHLPCGWIGNYPDGIFVVF